MELPLANLHEPVRHISAEYYYRIPVRPVYKTYPVYHPDREPVGYWSWLQQQEPQVVFDSHKLRTTDDWVKAGEMIFKGAGDIAGDLKNVRDPKWYTQLGIQLAADGTDPSARYIVTRKGRIEVRYTNCSSCHTRVLADGTVIVGAQGNPPVGRFDAANVRQQLAAAASESDSLKETIANYGRMFSVPWRNPDPAQDLQRLTTAQLLAALEAIPPGVVHRGRTSIFFPPKTPDLIGVNDRRYLDATGLVQHRTAADLMRYAATVDGAEDLAAFREFRVVGQIPDPATRKRFSDEQLYALAMYIYSLKPPTNPNRSSALTVRGEQVFRRQGCAGCHPPPLYTNNMLTPVDGFVVPREHNVRYEILPGSVGTDPRLALQTRKGTGYYRVPSLKGVWYRGPFEHNGSVATLEDWFDSRRLRDDYVPTGFKGYRVKTRAVKGHEFGLHLAADEKRALIAFLNTL
jgi:cytochrome c553